jgi:hypothetical protein
MKKVLLVLSLLLGVIESNAQDTLFVSKCSNIEWASNFRNSDEFNFIQFEDGSILKVGDKMKLGKPSGTNETKTVNKGLFSGSVTNENQFSYIMLGKMAQQMMGGMTYAPESFKNREVVIKGLKIIHSGLTKNSVAVPYLIFENPGLDLTTFNLKAALDNSELINLNRPMNRTEAIAKLKEAKDLVDLGMMSKEDFEKLKAELTPLIIKN